MKMEMAALVISLLSIVSADLVKVNYYAESLCPDCIALTTGAMDDAYKEVGEIFHLTYIPSGNAHLQTDGTLECQHGPMECLLNKVEACTVHYYETKEKYWPFIYCMAGYGQSQDLDVASKCASSNSLDWTIIKSCTDGKLGTMLQMEAYNKTAMLNPPHRYTPWITINGKHDTRAEGFQLVSVICEAYIGKVKPKACS